MLDQNARASFMRPVGRLAFQTAIFARHLAARFLSNASLTITIHEDGDEIRRNQRAFLLPTFALKRPPLALFGILVRTGRAGLKGSNVAGWRLARPGTI
ncbi:hypothetical protein [Aquamicrobium ahrensii]|uniref:Uncharacterized protein n=1 Tax=Aquamicrobium ahrensii TaxID=469551 RepID=A0ABV2KKA0_9HYPH